MRIARGAVGLQEAGCFCIVFEAVPSALTEELMPLMTVPIIGIGAGPATDGQVLVFHDLLGIREGMGAKFVRRYADLLDAMADGVAAVRQGGSERGVPGGRARLRHRRGRTGQVPCPRDEIHRPTVGHRRRDRQWSMTGSRARRCSRRQLAAALVR